MRSVPELRQDGVARRGYSRVTTATGVVQSFKRDSCRHSNRSRDRQCMKGTTNCWTVEWLGQHYPRRRARRTIAGGGGDEHHGDRPVRFCDRRDCSRAGTLKKLYVGSDEIGKVHERCSHGACLGISKRKRRSALSLENRLDIHLDQGLVFDNQHMTHDPSPIT